MRGRDSSPGSTHSSNYRKGTPVGCFALWMALHPHTSVLALQALLRSSVLSHPFSLASLTHPRLEQGKTGAGTLSARDSKRSISPTYGSALPSIKAPTDC